MVQIDIASPRPLEEQIVNGLRHALADGSLQPGDELPAVRQLAGDLGVHWNTVARAYRRLDQEGLLRVRHGRGAVVVARERLAVRAAKAGLRERFVEAIGAGVLAGLAHDAIDQVFRDALARFEGGQRS